MRFRLFLIFAWLSLLALQTGCFRYSPRAHPYGLRQTDLTQQMEDALASPAICLDDLTPKGPWWAFFKDEQLSKFIEMSLLCHPDIKVADARIRLACQEAKIARSALLPHIFFLVDVEREKLSELGEGFVPGFPDLFTQTTLELVTGVYELDIWQKNRSIYRSALDRMQAQVAEAEEAKLLLSTTIAAVYFDLQVNLARVELTKKRVEAKQELYDLHKQQFDIGIASEFRLYTVDTELQLLKDLLLQLEYFVALDQNALSALVGNLFCFEECVALPFAHFDEPFPLPSTLPIDLLNRRPDITAQKWIVESACHGIQTARADFFPRIDLIGSLGFQSIEPSQLFTGKTLTFLGDAASSLPLFTAGKLRAQLGVAHEGLEIAIEEYNQLVLNAVQEVSDALSGLVIADERKKTITKAKQDAEELLVLTEQKYASAIFSKLSVLNAKENYYLQKDLELIVELARFEAAVDLIRAIGGGYYAECP